MRIKYSKAAIRFSSTTNDADEVIYIKSVSQGSSKF